MSKKASQFQKKVMSFMYKGKGIFKAMNTGKIDDNVYCVREYIANIFFYTKNGKTIMIDAGYNYPRLKEKMDWLNLDPEDIKDILITHQDTDHVGAIEKDGSHLFDNSTVYLSEKENEYLEAKTRRKVYYGFYKLPQVTIDNKKVLLKDKEVFYIGDIKVEPILVPGHTWGHLVYLLDDKYLFTGDTIWLGADGGYSFINVLAEDNKLAKKSLKELRDYLSGKNIKPLIISGHTGWTSDFDFAFRHTDKVCHALRKQKPADPSAPYDGYIEDDDTKENANEYIKEAYKI